MAVVKRRVDGPTCEFEALPNDLFGELIPFMGEETQALMLVSKRIFDACANAQHAWRKLLPSRYRWVQNPCEISIKAWGEKRRILDDADRPVGDWEKNVLEKWGPRQWPQPSPERLVMDDIVCRIMRLYTPKVPDSQGVIFTWELQWGGDALWWLKTLRTYWPVRDLSPTTGGGYSIAREVIARIMWLWTCALQEQGGPAVMSSADVVRWVAIEKVLTDCIKAKEGDKKYLTAVMEMALLTKDYFSPEIFRLYSMRCKLINLLFILVRPRVLGHDYDSSWVKDLARFVLKNCRVLSLCVCPSQQVEQLETWFGSELPDLAKEYRIFGAQGLRAFWEIGWEHTMAWKDLLSRAFASKQVPQNTPGELDPKYSGDMTCRRYLEWLIRMSAYVFHDDKPLIHFVLAVVQNGHRKILQNGDNCIDLAYLDKFLVDFNEALRGPIEELVAHSAAPLCPNGEYQKDRDFVARFGRYLTGRLALTPK